MGLGSGMYIFAKAVLLANHVELHRTRKMPKATLKEPITKTNTEKTLEKVEEETESNEIKGQNAKRNAILF